MDKIKYVLYGAICIGVGILIGLTARPNQLATVVVSNSSNRALKSVNISVGMTTYIIDNIETNMSKSVNIFVAGEAGYKIKVSFPNGDTLVNYNYVEPGNKIKETVSDTKMVSSFIKK